MTDNQYRALFAVDCSFLTGKIDDRIEWCRAVSQKLEALILELGRGSARSTPASQLGRFVNGGAYTKHASGSGRLVIRIAELNSGVGGNSKYAELDAPPERTAFPGDILFSWSATLDAFRWVGEEALVNQHIFKVLPSDRYPGWLVYAKLKEAMPAFQKLAQDRATTMGHIKRNHLDQVVVEMPTDERLGEIRGLGDDLWKQHLRVNQEANNLAQIRDTLLPKLLSGELRVKDPQRLLEGVA